MLSILTNSLKVTITSEIMRKLLVILVISITAIFNACNPTAKEIEFKRIADSIRVADSLAMVQAKQQLNRIEISQEEIPNPLELEYEYLSIIKADDGKKFHSYVQKGYSDNEDGDYCWSKMVPLYASQSDAVEAYEYQMDFSETDVRKLHNWIFKNMGENLRAGAIDAPPGFKGELSLSVIYDYCVKHKSNFILGIGNKEEKKLLNIIFDFGENEIGVVYFILF